MDSSANLVPGSEGAGRLRHPYQGLHPEKRPRTTCPLSRWMKEKGIGLHAFSKLAGVSPQTARWWVAGRCLPTLVAAYRIERATRGAVPASSWLGTPLGRAMWEAMERSAEKRVATQRKAARAYEGRNREKRLKRAKEKRVCERLADDPLFALEDA